MIKTMIDGKVHGRYDQVWIDIGSSKDADVRLSWAEEKHLTIRPMSYGDVLVEIHSKDGMWHKNKLRLRDPDGCHVPVREGETVTICGHVLTVQKC